MSLLDKIDKGEFNALHFAWDALGNVTITLYDDRDPLVYQAQVTRYLEAGQNVVSETTTAKPGNVIGG